MLMSIPGCPSPTLSEVKRNLCPSLHSIPEFSLDSVLSPLALWAGMLRGKQQSINLAANYQGTRLR